MLGHKVESHLPHSPPVITTTVEVITPQQLPAVTIIPARNIVPPSVEDLPADTQVIITTEAATILPGTTLVSVGDTNSNDISAIIIEDNTKLLQESIAEIPETKPRYEFLNKDIGSILAERNVQQSVDEVSMQRVQSPVLMGIVKTLHSIRSELEILGIEITTREDITWVGLQLQRLGSLYTALEDSIKNLRDVVETDEKRDFSFPNRENMIDAAIQVSLAGVTEGLKGEIKEEHKHVKPVDTVKIEVDPDVVPLTFPEGIQGLRMAQAYINSTMHAEEIHLKDDGENEDIESKFDEFPEDDIPFDPQDEDTEYEPNSSMQPQRRTRGVTRRRRLKKRQKEDVTTNDVKVKALKCHVCQEVYQKASLLRAHLNEDHPDSTLPACDLCSKNFLTQRKLLSHKMIAHGQKQPIECEICKKVLFSKQSMKRHHATHTGENLHECDICHKKYAIAATLKSHKMVTHFGIKPYTCKTCGKAFAKPIHLKSHQVVHTGEKPFKCDLCDKAYSNSGHLWTHKANSHEGFRKPKAKLKEPSVMSEEDKDKQKIMCGECGKLFASAASLKVHEKMHTGEARKKIMCVECGKWFASPISLKVHERIHTGEKPYKCELCPKAFAQYSALIAHQDVHNKEQKYTCDICSKSFYHKVSLHLHIKRHTAPKFYPCDVCGKSFTENYNLKRHAITHTGEKPFACEICGRGFTQPQLLKQHMPVHTGERAFKCDTCGKAFTQSSSLSVHRKKYH